MWTQAGLILYSLWPLSTIQASGLCGAAIGPRLCACYTSALSTVLYSHSNTMVSKNKLPGAAEVAQWLGAYTVLPEDLQSLVAPVSIGLQQMTADFGVAHSPSDILL